jgi:hypothetical protein
MWLSNLELLKKRCHMQKLNQKFEKCSYSLMKVHIDSESRATSLSSVSLFNPYTHIVPSIFYTALPHHYSISRASGELWAGRISQQVVCRPVEQVPWTY